jgi:hypothetical protein
MASKTKKAKAIRKWKEKPHKWNQKKDQERIQKNLEILRELGSKSSS